MRQSSLVRLVAASIAAPLITALLVTPAAARILVGKTTQLSAKAVPDNADGSVTWTSNSPAARSMRPAS